MAKRQNITVRFAFGTNDEPGSAVWRVNVVKKIGDIYINNAPKYGQQIHISLHASGKFDIKFDDKKRFPLEPPWKDPSGVTCGPAIFFFNWKRNLPPPRATGKTKEIKWLGWPDEDHIFIVRTFYCEPENFLRIDGDEILLGGPNEAQLFYSNMHFYLIVEHRKTKLEEISEANKSDIKEIDFDGKLPNQGELVRISKTPEGPSAIVIEPFNVKSSEN